MRNAFFSILQLLIIATAITSCSKEEGEGGKGKITGHVFKIIDDGSIVANGDGTYRFEKDTFLAKDEDVYIIYGSNEYGFDDKTKTSFDGSYQFNYLYSGDYKVFAYSDLASGDKEAVISNVNIKKENDTKADDIVIYDGKNVGKCGVVGQIYAQWKDSGLQPAVGVRVYIKKVGSTTTSDTRADDNGFYSFAKLDPNASYILYAENELVKNEGITAASVTITTGEAGSITGVERLNVSIY